MSVNPAAPIRPIAVIGGTGPAGMGLALRWARAGETVIIGSREADRAQRAAATIQQRLGGQGIYLGHGEQRRLCRLRHPYAHGPV